MLINALILTTVIAIRADSHTLRLRVYYVPAACAPALAATFPDAFAPHPGPKTSGHPAWPGATPGMTPARPHHTSTHTHTNIDGHNHNRTKQPPFTDSHSLIRGSGKTPIIHMGPDTHMQRQQHPHSPQEERKRREKTGIVGLPQEHYSNASQRLPTKEREKDRERNRWGQRKNESSSSHLRTASSSGMLHERFCVCCSMRLWAHRNTNSKMLLWYFLMPMKSLRCRWSFPLSFQCRLSLKEFWILLFSSAFTFATKM